MTASPTMGRTLLKLTVEEREGTFWWLFETATGAVGTGEAPNSRSALLAAMSDLAGMREIEDAPDAPDLLAAAQAAAERLAYLGEEGETWTRDLLAAITSAGVRPVPRPMLAMAVAEAERDGDIVQPYFHNSPKHSGMWSVAVHRKRGGLPRLVCGDDGKLLIYPSREAAEAAIAEDGRADG